MGRPKDHNPKRDDARVAGLTVYNGKPCRVCAGITRLVKDNRCQACVVKAIRKWRKTPRGKEAQRSYRVRWWDKNKEKYIKDPDLSHRQYLLRKEAHSESMRTWQKNNKDKTSAYCKAYKKRMKDQLTPGADLVVMKSFYAEARRLTRVTGIKHEVDHIIPLSKGGAHHQDNMRVITTVENRRKKDKIPNPSTTK